MPDRMPHLQAYLQRVVGDRGRMMITDVLRYDSWAELPWDEGNLAEMPKPLPAGRVYIIGMRDTYLSTATPGPEAFVALREQDQLLVAAELANLVIGVRRNVG